MKDEGCMVMLPITPEEFNDFCNDIFEIYSLPATDDHRTVIARMIQHLGPTVTEVNDKYFADSITKAMANNAAFEAIEAIRKKQKEQAEADEMAKQEALKQIESYGEPLQDACIQAPTERMVSEVTR